MTRAQEFYDMNLGDVGDLMTSLNNAQIESEQETTWFFSDGSRIIINNENVTIDDGGRNE